LPRRMLSSSSDERPDDDEPVHHSGQSRHVLADVQAGQVRRDRPILAPDSIGRVRLQVMS
jgi:hypothetical protein